MQPKDTLHILWVNNDPITAKHMVFMYAVNSLRNGWWQQVHLLVWGGAAKLLSENAELQEMLREFMDEGGEVSACRRCAEQLGLVDSLKAIEGLNLYYVGERFSTIIKSGEGLITV